MSERLLRFAVVRGTKIVGVVHARDEQDAVKRFQRFTRGTAAAHQPQTLHARRMEG